MYLYDQAPQLSIVERFIIYAILNHFQILPQDGSYGIADLEISPPPHYVLIT